MVSHDYILPVLFIEHNNSLNMLRSFVPLVLMCLVMASCSQTAEDPSAEAGPPDASALLESDMAFAQLSADSGAVFAFNVYLSEDAVQMPSGTGLIMGRDNIVAAMASGPEMTLLWEPQHAEIAVSGELGWTWGKYEARFVDGDGEEVTSAGKYLNIWRQKDDGSWRVQVDMGNSGI